MRLSEELRKKIAIETMMILFELLEEVKKDRSKLESHMVSNQELAKRVFEKNIVTTPKAHFLMGFVVQQVSDFFPRFLQMYKNIDEMTDRQKLSLAIKDFGSYE